MSPPSPRDPFSVSTVADAAGKIRGPWQFAALVVLVILSIVLQRFDIIGLGPAILIAALALPLLAFAAIPWGKLTSVKPGGVIVLLVVLVMVSALGVLGALWVSVRPRESGVKTLILGSVDGLIDQDGVPLNTSGAVRIRQWFEVADHPDQFYRTRPSFSNPSTLEYGSKWALLAEYEVHRLTLRVAQEWSRVAPHDPLALPEPVVKLDTSRRSATRDFVLNLDSLHLPGGQEIALVFEQAPHAIEDSVGSLFLVNAQGRIRLSLASEDGSGPPSVGHRSLSFELLQLIGPSVAAAQQITHVRPFDESGRYDARIGDALYQGLQSPDWLKQQSARDVLTKSGTRACRFVADHLSPGALSKASDKGRLIQNLADAVQTIETDVPNGCPHTHLPLALAYYGIRDYTAAANWFDRVPEADLSETDWWYFRGFAYRIVGGKDELAISSLTTFLARNPSRKAQASAHTLLGFLYMRTQRNEDAVRHYRLALSLRPTGAVLGDAANNLAFLYGEMFVRNRDSLQRAIAYVNRALGVSPDYPNFLDTKGWILFRLGRCGQAEPLLARAAARRPTYQAHLDSVRRATQPDGSCR